MRRTAKRKKKRMKTTRKKKKTRDRKKERPTEAPPRRIASRWPARSPRPEGGRPGTSGSRLINKGTISAQSGRLATLRLQARTTACTQQDKEEADRQINMHTDRHRQSRGMVGRRGKWRDPNLATGCHSLTVPSSRQLQYPLASYVASTTCMYLVQPRQQWFGAGGGGIRRAHSPRPYTQNQTLKDP